MQPIDLVLILFELVALAVALSIHDTAQAWTANRLGDPTARMLGRITMNPMMHFDPWGTGLMPLLSIFIFHNPLPLAWTKPVPMTYRNFPAKNGEMLSVCAGPVAQLLTATIALVLLIVLKHTVAGAEQSLGLVALLSHRVVIEGIGDRVGGIFPLLLLLYMAITTNLMLLVFNLLPMPFLDGGRILLHFLPFNAARAFERYSMVLMIGFFFLAGPLIMIGFTPLMAVFNSLLLAL
jgi:Zn-dependent protease